MKNIGAYPVMLRQKFAHMDARNKLVALVAVYVAATTLYSVTMHVFAPVDDATLCLTFRTACR